MIDILFLLTGGFVFAGWICELSDIISSIIIWRKQLWSCGTPGWRNEKCLLFCTNRDAHDQDLLFFFPSTPFNSLTGKPSGTFGGEKLFRTQLLPVGLFAFFFFFNLFWSISGAVSHIIWRPVKDFGMFFSPIECKKKKKSPAPLLSVNDFILFQERRALPPVLLHTWNNCYSQLLLLAVLWSPPAAHAL